MVCPFCLHEKTTVYNSRNTYRVNVTWRRRRCLNCGREFTTHETVDCQKILEVTDGGHHKPQNFSHAKLLISILKACDHRTDLDEAAYMLSEAIEHKLLLHASRDTGKITKKQITDICLVTLKNFDPAAYLKYLANHSPAMNMRSIKKQM